jgi:quercetin dioxygenase-like cupin family protein
MRAATLSATIVLICSARMVAAQLEPSCVENSPERRGEIGCSLVENKPLPPDLKAPLVWHIDRFTTEAAARAAVGPSSVAFSAHGIAWLMTIETAATDHHGGQHMAAAAMPALPPAEKYAMLAMSAYIPSGLTSRFHHHSGVEGFFVVDGQQCLETADRTYVMNREDALVIPAGIDATCGNGTNASPSLGSDRLRRLAAANDEDGGRGGAEVDVLQVA